MKQKIRELKQRKQEKIPEATLRNAVAKQMQEDPPPNYLAIIASAITLANIREQECPGVYQYIVCGEFSPQTFLQNVCFKIFPFGLRFILNQLECLS